MSRSRATVRRIAAARTITTAGRVVRTVVAAAGAATAVAVAAATAAVSAMATSAMAVGASVAIVTTATIARPKSQAKQAPSTLCGEDALPPSLLEFPGRGDSFHSPAEQTERPPACRNEQNQNHDFLPLSCFWECKYHQSYRKIQTFGSNRPS